MCHLDDDWLDDYEDSIDPWGDDPWWDDDLLPAKEALGEMLDKADRLDFEDNEWLFDYEDEDEDDFDYAGFD